MLILRACAVVVGACAMLVGCGTVAAAGCTSLDGLTGGSADASDGGDSAPPDATDAPPGNPQAEDCLDGVDNDGDGLTDCADKKCQVMGYRCANAPPAGWDAYIVSIRSFADGGAAAAPSLCAAGGAPTRYYDGPENDTGFCTTCACGAPDPVSCNKYNVDLFDGGACYGATLGTFTFPTSGCTNQPKQSTGPIYHCHSDGVPSAKSVTCPPSGGRLLDSWTHVDDACRVTVFGGGGCSAGQVCVSAGMGVSKATCLLDANGAACPLGYAPQVLYVASAVTDSRSCSNCSCSSFSPTCSGGQLSLFNDSTCGGAAAATVTGGQCNDVSIVVGDWSGRVDSAPTLGGVGATCAASGGVPSGTITRGTPVTFCCAQ